MKTRDERADGMFARVLEDQREYESYCLKQLGRGEFRDFSIPELPPPVSILREIRVRENKEWAEFVERQEKKREAEKRAEEEANQKAEEEAKKEQERKEQLKKQQGEDFHYTIWDPSHDSHYKWDRRGFWREKTLEEEMRDYDASSYAAACSRGREIIRKRKARGAVAYWVQTIADYIDRGFVLLCMVLWPFMIVYFPVRLLAKGVWELIYWTYSNAPRWLTRAVKAARTRARDFEKATRPE
jgi:hypothetical protein